MRFTRDSRALANNLLIFAATLAIGAVLYFILGDIGIDLIEFQSSVGDGSEAAAQGRNYQRWTWESLPFLIIGLGFIQLLAAAAFEARVGP